MNVWARTALRVAIAFLLASFLLDAEGTRVLFAAGAEVAGEWETFLLAREVPAVATLALVPFVVVVAAFAAMVPLLDTRRGRIAWGVAMAMIAAPFAIELTTGRKAHVPAVRVPFVLALVVVAFVLAAEVAPRVRRFARPAPSVAFGAALLALSVVVDARVLPRLYPVFHHALVATAAIGLVIVADALVDVLGGRRWSRYAWIAIAAFATFRAYATVRRTLRAGPALAKYDNARRIADERSAILSRAVSLAARRWPPPPLDDGETGSDPLATTSKRAIDATGRDLLLVTIDALRADHVGTYGYRRDGRSITPEIDRLGDEGVVFTHAYTPTPHTSYAITSLMTGKYMRPILALESAAGGGRRPDETWAGLFRVYGYRTAAFFPPAVWAVDGDRFADLRTRMLDFEHAKIEFAAPDLTQKQLETYLASAPKDKPLFVWIHLFEPHEPYVTHPAHAFGDGEIDRYDSEIAAADEAVGALVKTFRGSRPRSIVMLSADHGEAFGEHGARYHGTTVYEEQVRVPLVVNAPGLLGARRDDRPVQLVDLLPTSLSMMGIPRPPRVRGRDLGAALVGKDTSSGIAFAEVEDAAMIGRGDDRLVCNKKLATCALYDVKSDPAEQHPLNDEAKVRKLRADMKALVIESAALERTDNAQGWPEALRRAYAGDPTAAAEVAPLLDDVDVAYRRRAAEVLAHLAQDGTEPALRRAWTSEQDLATKRWIAVGLVRVSKVPPGVPLATVGKLVEDAAYARWAALAIGEARQRGVGAGPTAEAKAFEVLVDWLPQASSDGELGRAILAVLPVVHEKGTPSARAVKVVVPLLDDVRLRVAAADALGLLGDLSAAKELDARLAKERHQDVRAAEAKALARVGEAGKALRHLQRFLGVPVPAPGAADALAFVARFGDEPHPWVVEAREGRARVVVPRGDAHRLVVVGPSVSTVKIAGAAVTLEKTEAGAIAELGDRLKNTDAVLVEAPGATWIAIVPRVADLPPPKPPRSVNDPEVPDGEP